jgi:hypothetical protein
MVRQGKMPQMSKDYKVGKGRPPLHSRFKPGQSGNPKGRPKGIGSQELIRKLLSRKVTVREGEYQRTATVLEAILLGLITKAAKGDHKAAAFLFGFLDIGEDPTAQSRDIEARAGVEEFTQRILQLRERISEVRKERDES